MFIHAEREFKIMKRLESSHHIVEGIEYIPYLFRSSGYIVMEKIGGMSLLDKVF
jgi:serine/threonine protein kinase